MALRMKDREGEGVGQHRSREEACTGHRHRRIVTSPPSGSADPLHDEQPVRVHLLNGIAHSLRRQPPVRGEVSRAPGGVHLGLVPQVRRDDGGVAVAARQHDPIVDEALLRVVRVAG